MKTLKWLLIVAVLVIVALCAVLIARAVALPTERSGSEVEPVRVEVDAEAVAARLAAALRFKTVSYHDPAQFQASEFEALRAYLESSFPLVHEHLEREIVGGFTLLYRWPGTDDARAPVLLMAHQDVVPVIPGTESDWAHGAFSGAVADGFVWGRGALDDKVGVLGLLEAVEALLAEGYEPPRTIYLLFGHDEEVGGRAGAAAVAALFEARGVRFEFVVDEGGVIGEGLFPGVEVPVALVGVAEKGYVSVELTARGTGGHASTPPRRTAIGVVARAVSRLEENPFPANRAVLERQLTEYLAPVMSFPLRIVAANLWLFEPVLDDEPQLSAAIRTTTAATIIAGGTKDNVLPIDARAVINHRVMPGETAQSVVERDRAIIDDPDVGIELLTGSDPSPVASVDAAGFGIIARSIHEVAGAEIVVSPFLLPAATDSSHFVDLADDVYRFNFFRGDSHLLARIHGTNERISIADYADAVRFYQRLIRNAG